MGRLLALVGALIVAVLIAWTVQQPPKPRPASAPAAIFSAERAMADIRAFASRPHPIGSETNHAARDYLLGRMTALGLAPQIHRGVGVRQAPQLPGVLLGGEVENLVGVLPGRDRAAPALTLMAHYDSVPGSSGAADDGAGVASILEIVRVIAAQGRPARDVMVVLTDGEEPGLLGSNAFFRRDPMAKHVGLLINVDARGDAGRVQMFETGSGPGGDVALLRHTVSRPQASSLAVYVYQRMPNDTDFTEARRAGVAGMNYGFLGRQFDYHAASSTAATLDPGTLQDVGDQVLGPARAAAFGPALPAAAPPLTFSQLFGDILLAYPPAAGWLILLAAAGLLAVALARARRIEAFPWTDVARGAGAALFATLGAMTVLHFARRATGADFGYLEQRFLLAEASRWETALLLLGLGFLLAAISEIGRGRRQIAFLPLAAGLAGSLFGGFDPVGLGMGVAASLVALASYGRPVSRAGAWAGALTLGLVLAIAAQALAPTAAFIFAWPVALGALGAAATDLSERRGLPALIVLGLMAAVGVGWLGGYAHQAFLSLDLVELMTLTVAGAALLIWPLAQPAEGAPPERLIGPALIIVGLAVTVAVRVNDPYNARFPEASQVIYQQDQDAGRAWLVSLTPDRPGWSEAVLKSGGGKIAKLKAWPWAGPVDAGPAPVVPEPRPEITLVKQADGTLLLHAAPPAGGRRLVLGLQPDTPAVLVSADGVPVGMALPPGALSRVRWEAAPQGLSLVLRPSGPGKLAVSYSARLDRWPAGLPPLPRRPANVMAFNDSDSAYLTGSRRFAW
ncbi:M28 family peptidase [Phenylobacterium sp.]|uniref:M28 family peptidase n=1 Tax=Phenylobacterium sp. TaxID=1871053 RepID=UPI002DED5562|nr:M28 family peptidase [Phenylobacterium sp.]